MAMVGRLGTHEIAAESAVHLVDRRECPCRTVKRKDAILDQYEIRRTGRTSTEASPMEPAGRTRNSRSGKRAGRSRYRKAMRSVHEL